MLSNEELQKQANDISRQQVAATYASIEVQKANLRATIAMQNRIEGMAIVQDGRQTYSTSPTNYYETVDKNGKVTRHNVNNATNLVKDPNGNGNAMYFKNGNYYVQDSDGNVYKVYNSDKAHADAHAAKYNTISNYKE